MKRLSAPKKPIVCYIEGYNKTFPVARWKNGKIVVDWGKGKYGHLSRDLDGIWRLEVGLDSPRPHVTKRLQSEYGMTHTRDGYAGPRLLLIRCLDTKKELCFVNNLIGAV